MPVGLSFAARKRFRRRVLVSFGEPVDLSSYLAVYREEPPKALHTLTTAIQWAMEREVVHVERIDTAALARAVERAALAADSRLPRRTCHLPAP